MGLGKDSKDSLVGSLVDGRYLVEGELGAGGLGVVYLARDLKVLGRKVVVKVLLQEAYQNEYVVKKFRQEAEALSRIDHPNIVSIYDYGEMKGGHPYLVLQYIDGSSLRDIIRPGGIDLERAAHIVRAVSHALTVAHDKGILHRDLKPENVMLQSFGEEERVVVIDFGIAQIQDSVIAQKTVVASAPGTIAYMSPEQLSGGALTPASDTYALGVIAYELVTGQKPFSPQTPYQLPEMQRAGVTDRPADLRPDLPAAAQEAILRALSFNAEERQQRTREFGNAFSRAITGSAGAPTGNLAPPPPAARTTAPGTHPTESNLSELRSMGMTSPENLGGGGEREGAAVEPPPPPAHDAEAPLPASRPHRMIFVGAAALLLFSLAAAAAVGFFVWRSMRTPEPTPDAGLNANTRPAPRTPSPTPAPTPAAPERARLSLEYSLTVQMMRNGKPYREPFESTGRERYESGSMFWMNLSAQGPGYLYLLNEGPNERGDTVYTVLYPTSSPQGGTRIAGGQKVRIPETDGYVFGEGVGTEKIWIIFSERPVDEMEALKGLMNPEDEGEVSDPAQITSVRNFLSKHKTAKTEETEDRSSERIAVKSSEDILVHLTELRRH